ncbi:MULTISPECIES: hypothetical protein [Marinobacter]|uniref:Uncharacterized protein n=2 Tax=Marinobacter TaxID=2742 RepID=A0A1M2UYP4_MARNT|nr:MULTISPECIES: hypothetical protein [Marinobacter]MAO13474.1 hypothetical protein [Marinobacter sp.]OJT00429.1 hypothetical protein BEE62_10295 [Marinobacter nauticus]|tara:strand:+ start:2035 stop:2235 length:201 start_codon:yes stop_codon:yes gene_type:complete
MSRNVLIKIALLVLILGGALMVLIKDDPRVPTGDINQIRPVMPVQESQYEEPVPEAQGEQDQEQNQ